MNNIIIPAQLQQRTIKPEVLITNDEVISFDVSDFVLSINTDNSIERPVATMQVTFSPALNIKGNITYHKISSYLKNKIKLYSIISCKIDKDDTHPSFVGLVVNVYEGKRTSNTSTSRTIVANVSLLITQALLRDSLPNSPTLQGNKLVEKILGKARVQFFQYLRGSEKNTYPFTNKPESAIKWILENAPSMNVLAKGINVTLKSLINSQKKIKNSEDKILDMKFLKNEWLFDPSLSIFYGNIYQYIRRCLDTQFYEMFADSVTGDDDMYYNSLVIRPKPFSYLGIDNKKVQQNGWQYWDSLDTISFQSDYRISEDLGVSDFEIKNFIHVENTLSLIAPSKSEVGMFGSMFPIINFDSIKKYGLRELAGISTMLNLDEFTDKYNKTMKNRTSINSEEFSKNDLSFLLEKRNKIWEWYGYGFFETGNLTALGNAEYKIGRKLYYADKEYTHPETGKKYKGMEYYINRVNHNFRYPNYYTTTLGLTRGQPVGLVPKWLKEIEKGTDNKGNPLLMKVNDISKVGIAINSIDSKKKREKREKKIEKAI